MIRVLAAIGVLAILAAGVAGCSAYYEARIAQARATGNAEGFIQGLSLGMEVQKQAPRGSKL